VGRGCGADTDIADREGNGLVSHRLHDSGITILARSIKVPEDKLGIRQIVKAGTVFEVQKFATNNDLLE